MDEFFHDVGDGFVAFPEEFGQILVVGELVGVAGAHAVVRFHHHGIAHFGDEGFAGVPVVHQMVARHRDAGFLVVFLHFGFVLDAGNVGDLEAAGDVEVGAQLGVAFQPVFVVGFQPVDAAVFEDEEGHGAVHFVIVFQTGNLVVFVEAGFQFRFQFFIRLVADSQYVQAVLFQFTAEHPVVGGEVRRDKDKVFHVFPSFHFSYPWYSETPFGESARCYSPRR